MLHLMFTRHCRWLGRVAMGLYEGLSTNKAVEYGEKRPLVQRARQQFRVVGGGTVAGEHVKEVDGDYFLSTGDG